jgi:hypothetical protein
LFTLLQIRLAPRESLPIANLANRLANQLVGIICGPERNEDHCHKEDEAQYRQRLYFRIWSALHAFELTA